MNSNTTFVYTQGAKVPRDIVDVIVDASVTLIKEKAFYECRSLVSIKLPESVTVIEDEAFGNCFSLVSINLPELLHSIGEEAFGNCSSLVHVRFPQVLSFIGRYAFLGCSSLTDLTFPESLTSIRAYTFAECSSLTSVTFPESIISIGEEAFALCNSLTHMTLPHSLHTISIFAFLDCSVLATIIAPSFSLLISDPDSAKLEAALRRADFDTEKNLTNILNSDNKRVCYYARGECDCDDTIFYNTKIWWKVSAMTKDQNGRLPLCIGAIRSLKWFYMRLIFAAHMPAIIEGDACTGLQLFMLAAVGPESDLDSIYGLLREHPAAIGVDNII